MADEEVPALYRRIRALAEGLRLSDEAISRDAGLDRDFVRNIKRGKSGSPSMDNMRKLARALQCELDDLLPDQSPSMSAEERELLKLYQGVPMARRRDFIDGTRMVARLVATDGDMTVERGRRAKGGA